METLTVKELREATEILGTHTRDLVNSNIDLKNRIAYFERLRDAVSTAARVVKDDLASNEKLTAENERLKKANADLEKTGKSLRADTTRDKELWMEAARQLEAKRAELEDLTSQVESAKEYLSRAEEAKRLLDSFSAKH